MFKSKTVIALSAFVAVLLAAVGVMVFSPTPLSFSQNRVTIWDVLSEEVLQTFEISTVTYNYTTNVVDVNCTELSLPIPAWLGITIPPSCVVGTSTMLVAEMDGTIKIGIDGEKITFFGDEAQKTITVTLPPSQILSHEISDVKVLVDRSGIWADNTVGDWLRIQGEQSAEMELRAENQDLFSQASQNAEDQLESFIKAIIQVVPDAEQYQITIQTAA